MLKNNKKTLIVSVLVIMLPMLAGLILWQKLPDRMPVHWGADGVADGMGSKAFVVFVMPVIFLLLHFSCLVLTSLDKRQREQHPKALGLMFYIVPMISLFTSAIMYRAVFGLPLNVTFLLPALSGLLFVYMGNYIPKVKQNSTLGIKLAWTLNNEENWNKTHRFAGKLWVAGGLAMIVGGAFLPFKIALRCFISLLLIMVAAPTLYSYRLYRQHKKAGVSYTPRPKTKAERIAVKITAVFVPLVLIGAGILMFTGDIEVACQESTFSLQASYYKDLTVSYSEVGAVRYEEELDVGFRTYGFGSARLSIGTYENDAFGLYTLYAYTNADGYVILTAGEKTLVIGLRGDSAQALYQTLLEKTGP
ncbi:MAG: SdpI family protein [Clostridia bacterium]|nr:SdpI family protein [Clostridia bacterium]